MLRFARPIYLCVHNRRDAMVMLGKQRYLRVKAPMGCDAFGTCPETPLNRRGQDYERAR